MRVRYKYSTLFFNLLEKPPLTDPKLKEVFTNPKTGKPWVAGDVYYRRDFADTLEQLAKV
jgi:gamma-glutamyltranspeptidase